MSKASTDFIIYVAEFREPFGLNASPLYGLFSGTEEHPLSINSFASIVSIQYGKENKRKKSKKPVLYAAGSGTPLCIFLRSDTPRPFPDDVLDFLRAHNVSFSNGRAREIPENAIVFGYGEHAEKHFGEEYAPRPLGITYERPRIIPYAKEVVKYLKYKSDEWIGDSGACDFALSYIEPALLPDLYASFETLPTSEEVVTFIKRHLADTPAYAEQVARAVLVLSSIAVHLENVKRYIGAGLLSFSSYRYIPFPYAFSRSPQQVEWEELHRIVLSRKNTVPIQTSYPVVNVEDLPYVRFYYRKDMTYNTPRGRTLAFCRIIADGIMDCVISFPSALVMQLPPYADVSLTRMVMNSQVAKRSGVEAWKIELGGEIDAFSDLSPQEVCAFLQQIAIARERPYRPATR